MLLTNKLNQLRHNFWLIWFLIILLVVLIHSLTLTVSPPIMGDEVQIIEYGRAFLNPNTDWSMNWDVANNRPFTSLFYLGCLLQEIAFSVANFSIFGSRLMGVIGSSIAATTLVLYLLNRHVNPITAALLGLSFLLDPIFVASSRLRVDCWAIALCLGSCYLLRVSLKRIQNNQRCFVSIGVAGSLSAAAFFVWPSVLIIYPLILLELWYVLVAVIQGKKIWKDACQLLLVFGTSFLLICLLLIIPIIGNLDMIISDFSRATRAVSKIGIGEFINFATSFIRGRSLVLPVLASFALVYVTEKSLAITTLLALSIVISTGVTPDRCLYAFPYLILLVSNLYSQPTKSIKSRNLNPRIKAAFLLVLVGYAVTISLIMRPVLGLSNQNGRNTNLLVNAGKTHIGEGEYKIWDSTWQFYETGRLLKWKMYQPFWAFWGIEDNDNSHRFIDNLDYVILQHKSEDKIIEKRGFRLQKTIRLDSGNQSNEGILNRLTKSLNSQTAYGPYDLYSR